MKNLSNFHAKTAIFAGILGFLGVLCGALGAHALQARLAESGMTRAWDTAVLYQLVHAVALLALAAWLKTSSGAGGECCARWLRRAAICWVAGVTMFSGSLYFLALGGPSWLGPMTPLGGLTLLAGWGCVLAAGLRQNQE